MEIRFNEIRKRQENSVANQKSEMQLLSEKLDKLLEKWRLRLGKSTSAVPKVQAPIAQASPLVKSSVAQESPQIQAPSAIAPVLPMSGMSFYQDKAHIQKLCQKA